MMRIMRVMRRKRTPQIPKDPQLQEWGEQIASRRAAFGLTQEALAELMEPPVHQSTVARWECGTAEPRRHHKQRLAEVLNTDARYLFPIRRVA